MSASIKSMVATFRVRELQECLDRLGLKRGGNKSELQARLLDMFSDASAMLANGYMPRDQSRVDSAKRVVEEVYRRRVGGSLPIQTRAPIVNHPESMSPGLDELLHAVLNDDTTTIRCICQRNVDNGTEMIQCEGENCGVWQHMSCVGLGTTEPPDHFFCELCRVQRADPFWEVTSTDILPPTKLQPTGKQQPVGTSQMPVKCAERIFTLYGPQFEQIRRQSGKYKLQLASFMLNDPVPFRIHWPLSVTVMVNNLSYRVYGRSTSSKLGANARDEAADLVAMCSLGRNRVNVTAADERNFVFLAMLVRKRQKEEVKALMKRPLSLEAAVSRVKEQVRGDDLDGIETVNANVSLRDPLSGSRITTAARFHEVPGLGAFDLDVMLDMCERTRKWQCPHSMRNSSIFNLQLDPYIQAILTALVHAPHVTDVEIAPNAFWRPSGSMGRWMDVMNPTPLDLMVIKPEPKNSQASEGSDSEEDEREELRRAATDMMAGNKRAREAANNDVIDLISDSDDEAPPPPAKQRSQPASTSAAQSRAPPSTSTAVPASALASTSGQTGAQSSQRPNPPQPPGLQAPLPHTSPVHPGSGFGNWNHMAWMPNSGLQMPGPVPSLPPPHPQFMFHPPDGGWQGRPPEGGASQNPGPSQRVSGGGHETSNQPKASHPLKIRIRLPNKNGPSSHAARVVHMPGSSSNPARTSSGSGSDHARGLVPGSSPEHAHAATQMLNNSASSMPTMQHPAAPRRSSGDYPNMGMGTQSASQAFYPGLHPNAAQNVTVRQQQQSASSNMNKPSQHKSGSTDQLRYSSHPNTPPAPAQPSNPTPQILPRPSLDMPMWIAPHHFMPGNPYPMPPWPVIPGPAPYAAPFPPNASNPFDATALAYSPPMHAGGYNPFMPMPFADPNLQHQASYSNHAVVPSLRTSNGGLAPAPSTDPQAAWSSGAAAEPVQERSDELNWWEDMGATCPPSPFLDLPAINMDARVSDPSREIIELISD